MNIKGLGIGTLQRIEANRTQDTKGAEKSHDTADRDADGRRHGSQQEQKQNLSDIEFQAALEQLKKTPAILDYSLTVSVKSIEGVRVVFIADPMGKVLRRLSEAELWLVTRNSDKPTGRILDRTG